MAERVRTDPSFSRFDPHILRCGAARRRFSGLLEKQCSADERLSTDLQRNRRVNMPDQMANGRASSAGGLEISKVGILGEDFIVLSPLKPHQAQPRLYLALHTETEVE